MSRPTHYSVRENENGYVRPCCLICGHSCVVKLGSQAKHPDINALDKKPIHYRYVVCTNDVRMCKPNTANSWFASGDEIEKTTRELHKYKEDGQGAWYRCINFKGKRNVDPKVHPTILEPIRTPKAALKLQNDKNPNQTRRKEKPTTKLNKERQTKKLKTKVGNGIDNPTASDTLDTLDTLGTVDIFLDDLLSSPMHSDDMLDNNAIFVSELDKIHKEGMKEDSESDQLPTNKSSPSNLINNCTMNTAAINYDSDSIESLTCVYDLLTEADEYKSITAKFRKGSKTNGANSTSDSIGLPPLLAVPPIPPVQPLFVPCIPFHATPYATPKIQMQQKKTALNTKDLERYLQHEMTNNHFLEFVLPVEPLPVQYPN